MPKLRILLADDHAVVREGLRSLINAQADMEVVGEAENGRLAVEAAKKLRTDLVVLDVSMPEMNGVQATEHIKRASPETRILALTMHEDKTYIRQLLEAGVSGYVLKRAAAAELIQAIRAVSAGGIYIDPTLAGKDLGGLLTRPSARGVIDGSCLSDREQEVLRLIARGSTNKEVAARLDVSVKTVETYKARSMEKLGLANRTEIVRYALERGWLADY